MRTFAVVFAVCLLVAAVSLVPVPKNVAASVGAESGDYWTYAFDFEELGLSMNGKMKMKITATQGSGSSEVFFMKLTGSGDYSGDFEGTSVDGGFEVSGYETRLVSNFSLVATSLEFEMTMKAEGISLSMKIGMSGTYSPALDDYILDNNPGLGGTLVSRSTLTEQTWMSMEILGIPQNESETITEQVTVTQQVASANETIEVNAGTFECYKVTVTESGNETGTSVMTYYFSDLVGNYVKTVGASSGANMMMGDVELSAYSYMGTGAGTSSLFSGTNLLIIIVVIVAIIVVVSLVLMLRRRSKPAAQMPMQAPPPEMGPPPPPPPGA